MLIVSFLKKQKLTREYSIFCILQFEIYKQKCIVITKQISIYLFL